MFRYPALVNGPNTINWNCRILYTWLYITASNSFIFNGIFKAEESRKDETCLQFKMNKKNYFIKKLEKCTRSQQLSPNLCSHNRHTKNSLRDHSIARATRWSPRVEDHGTVRQDNRSSVLGPEWPRYAHWYVTLASMRI